MKVEIIKTNENYDLPAYQSKGAAAIDLHAYPDRDRQLLPNGQTVIFRAGIKVHIKDPNYVGVIVPRSGLGIKEGIVLANGTGIIDSDYQGEIQIALRNMGSVARYIEKGERVAQMLFMPVVQADLVEVQEFGVETERGEAGLGSTGTKKEPAKAPAKAPARKKKAPASKKAAPVSKKAA